MVHRFHRSLGAAVFAVAIAAAYGAAAAPAPGTPMPLGARAAPPPGYIDFCRRRPEGCGADPSLVSRRLASLYGVSAKKDLAAAPQGAWSTLFAAARAGMGAVDDDAQGVSLTADQWVLVRKVNAGVNRAIIRRSDEQTYGAPDRWETPLQSGRRYGDCEDYVLEKRLALVAAGVPAQALDIAVVVTRWGETHVVLLLNADGGVYVLDNLTPWIVSWEKAPYRWRERQVRGDAFDWAFVSTDQQLAALDKPAASPMEITH